VQNLYAWALGHNVALVSLSNFATELSYYNRNLDGIAQPAGIRSDVLDLAPVRDIPLSGQERGDGTVSTAWILTITAAGYTHILNSKFAADSVISVAMTIYTYLHEKDSWGRYNCHAIRPSPAAGDVQYMRYALLTVNLRFNTLVASS